MSDVRSKKMALVLCGERTREDFKQHQGEELGGGHGTLVGEDDRCTGITGIAQGVGRASQGGEGTQLEGL